MKLKYYLRGLGIGIIVTAIIMSFTKKPEELTDAEIKIRAAQLGMVEESVLADIQKHNESSSEKTDVNAEQEAVNSEETVTNAEQETVNNEETVTNAEQETVNSEETVTNAEQEAVNSEETVTNAEQEAVNSEETVTNAEQEAVNSEETVANQVTEEEIISENEQIENYIIISVLAGNGSEIVCQRLFEAGLINSAVDYNRYLIENGYDKRLRVGNHEIPAGATEEEMAKILCGIN